MCLYIRMWTMKAHKMSKICRFLEFSKEKSIFDYVNYFQIGLFYFNYQKVSFNATTWLTLVLVLFWQNEMKISTISDVMSVIIYVIQRCCENGLKVQNKPSSCTQIQFWQTYRTHLLFFHFLKLHHLNQEIILVNHKITPRSS